MDELRQGARPPAVRMPTFLMVFMCVCVSKVARDAHGVIKTDSNYSNALAIVLEEQRWFGKIKVSPSETGWCIYSVGIRSTISRLVCAKIFVQMWRFYEKGNTNLFQL